MTNLPKFLNYLQYFFHNLKKKLKGGCQFVKIYLLDSILIKDIYKTLKEEYSEFKLWIQPQPVQELHTITTGCFMYLYLETNLNKLMNLLKSKIKNIINEELRFLLIAKLVFTGIKKNN